MIRTPACASLKKHGASAQTLRSSSLVTFTKLEKVIPTKKSCFKHYIKECMRNHPAECKKFCFLPDLLVGMWASRQLKASFL